MDIISRCDAFDGNRDEFAAILTEASKLARAQDKDLLTFLARECRTARGTASRWIHGHSAPPEITRLIAIRKIKQLFTPREPIRAMEMGERCDAFDGSLDQFRVIVRHGLTRSDVDGTDLRRHLSAEFDHIALTTVDRWASGVAKPGETMRRLIVASVKRFFAPKEA